MEVNTIIKDFGESCSDFMFILLFITIIIIYIYFKYTQWKREITINSNLTKYYNKDTCPIIGYTKNQKVLKFAVM